MVYIVEGDFSSDRQSKYDFTASTINHLLETGKSNINVTFFEFDDNGNMVEFDSPKASSTSRSDLIMSYNGTLYKIELKERKGKYVSDYYGKEGDSEGWMLNIEKKNELLKDKNFIPLFVNLYPDDKIRIWNLNKIEGYDEIHKDISKYTVAVSEKMPQERLGVWNKDSKIIDRIKGCPSNGKWSN